MEYTKLPTVNIKELEILAIKQVYRDKPSIQYNHAAELLGISESKLYRIVRENPGIQDGDIWVVVDNDYQEPVQDVAKELLQQIYREICNTGSMDMLTSIQVADYVNKHCIK